VIRHADSRDSCAAQVCFLSVPRPLLRPQVAQNCGFYSFHARIQILTKMYCYLQYLSINPKKVCHAHFNAHKLKKIVSMNVDISETIIDKKLDFQI